MKLVEETYKNERQYNKVRHDEKKAKHDSILELSRRQERMRQNQSMRDYKRHIKELQQGFPVSTRLITNLMHLSTELREAI